MARHVKLQIQPTEIILIERWKELRMYSYYVARCWEHILIPGNSSARPGWIVFSLSGRFIAAMKDEI
jgi:hypothetical protein